MASLDRSEKWLSIAASVVTVCTALAATAFWLTQVGASPQPAGAPNGGRVESGAGSGSAPPRAAGETWVRSGAADRDFRFGWLLLIGLALHVAITLWKAELDGAPVGGRFVFLVGAVTAVLSVVSVGYLVYGAQQWIMWSSDGVQFPLQFTFVLLLLAVAWRVRGRVAARRRHAEPGTAADPEARQASPS